MHAFEAALAPLGTVLVRATSAEAGLSIANRQPLDLAIIGIRMPAIDGFEIVRRLRGTPGNDALGVMLASASAVTGETLGRIYGLGAADFTTLPAPPEALRGRANLLLELRRQTWRAEARTREIQQTADAAIAAQTERFRLLADAASDYAIFFTDTGGIITEWTTSAEHLFGFSADEAVGLSAELIFTPEDRAQGAPEIERNQAAALGQAPDDRFHVRKDGTRFPVTGRLVALRNDEGVLSGFAKIVRDASALHELRESERRFREIFESANEGIWIIDADARIQVVNARMAEMLGYPREEIVGRVKTDFIFPADRATIAALFEERKLGKSMTVEVPFRRKDGTPLWTLMSARPRFSGDAFIGALDMFSDITARRAAEEQFRVFFESSAAGHVLIDPATRRFLNVNQRFCEIAGRSREELLTLTFTDITHPDDRPKDSQRFGELYAGRVSEVSAQKRYVRPDGSIAWVQLTSTVVNHETRKLQLTVVQDITALKSVERELTDSRTRLRLAIDAAELGVFYHDATTRESIWNERVKTLLGLAPEAAPSFEAFLARVHPEDRARVEQTLTGLLAGAAPQDFDLEYRVAWADGSVRHVATHGLTRPSAPGAAEMHVFGTMRDVTAERMIEEELRRKVGERTRELEEKTKQLESFCYTVAHDLRAPLRSINGYADLLIEELAEPDPQAKLEMLERIKTATRRLDLLIRDLLAYTRLTQVDIHFEPVKLGAAVQVALNELRPQIEHTKAAVHVDPAMPVIHGEKTIVEQMIVNLVSNAVKFTRPGRPPAIDISAEENGEWVRLRVRDQGIGIPASYQQRIFKVFERLQVSRDYPGTGIGLAIVAKGVERLGGRYGVESEPGQGSTFWIDLKKGHA